MTSKNEQVTPKAQPKPIAVKHDVTVHADDPKPYWAGCSCGWKSDGYLDASDALFIGAAHERSQ